MSFQAGFLGRRNREDRENKEDKEFREFKELRERVSLISLNSLNSLNSLIYHLNQRTNFLSEVPRFANKPKLHWKEVYLAYISFQGNELGGEDWCLSREINLLSEGRRVLHSEKMPPMGST